MKDWIKKGLENLDRYFPTERLEKSKQRIIDIWKGVKPQDRYPFTFDYALFNTYNALHSPEERLRASFDEFIIHGKLGDDFVPAVFPGCRQSTIPNMFGAEEIVIGSDVSCKEIVFSTEDIERLPEPEISPGSVASKWIEMERYFLEETEGKLPVHVTDMQGPLDVCGQLMSYDNLFLLAFDSPKHLHILMKKATRAFILFWKTQKELLGDLFVGTHLFGHSWVPPDFGASISVDSLVMYGSDFYTEFVAPYMSEIARELGPVSIHSCGKFSANVPAICATEGIVGINASQMTIGELVDAGLDKSIVLIVFSAADSLKKDSEVVRSNNLSADITIAEMPWPELNNEVKNPSQWSVSEWNHLQAMTEKISKELHN